MDASLRGHAAAQYYQQQQQQHHHQQQQQQQLFYQQQQQQQQQLQSQFPSQQQHLQQQQQQLQNQFPSQQQHQQRLQGGYHSLHQEKQKNNLRVGSSSSLGSMSAQRSLASIPQHQQAQHQQQQPQQHNDYMSVGSHFSRGSHASSQTSASVVDEAYRRLGHRLSRRAHGDGPLRQPKRVQHLGLKPNSMFEHYNRQVTPAREGDDEVIGGAGAAAKANDSNGLIINNRTNKVAKTRYNDHGDHQHKTPSQQGNVLKKMTMNCKEYYRQWHAETAASKGKGPKKRVVSSSTQPQQPPIGQDPQHQQQQEQQGQEHDEQQLQQQAQHLEQQGAQGNVDLSPQRFAFSQLALETGEGQQQQQQQQQQQHGQGPPLDPRHHDTGSGHHQQGSDQLPQQFFSQKEQHKGTHGLSAVIEQSSQASSRTHGTQSKGAGESVASRSSSIATKSTMGEHSAFRNASSLPRGKCLTQPPEPITNDNLDNCEGNLVVFENDTLRVGRKQIHSVTKDKIPNVSTMDFRIQGLLGQGTFAQVFQCLHLQTGKVVAVKIVKNKPAYTRQAVVEIDVFRALTKNDEANAANSKVPSSSQSQTGHRALSPVGGGGSVGGISLASTGTVGTKWDYMVNLECYFMYKNHLCLVFELLGLNLYEVLKRRQFRGLPLPVVRTLVRQAIRGVKELAQKSIVHCDLKPENILLVTEDDVELVVSAGEGRRLSCSLEKSKGSGLTASFEPKSNKMEPPAKVSGISSALGTFPTRSGTTTPTTQATTEPIPQSPGNSVATPLHQSISSYQKIKLIDFGSACFEGQTAHTYIQSRFYRSPEVLIGLPYDSAIDTWSLGCVAAELFLGLPILPGVHEHDQLCRVSEMISNLPAWMLDAGSKSSKYFVKYVPRPESQNQSNPSPSPIYLGGVTPSPRPQLPQWRVKSQQEYISSLSQSEIRKKGGLAKLEKQPTNRYFKRKKLSDIIMHKGQNNAIEDKDSLELFVHFLYGLLDPDPWKRWTAHQACQHPFITGGTVERRSSKALSPDGLKDQNHANAIVDIYWEPPWDPGICRRKLLNVQKMRERQQGARRGYTGNRRSIIDGTDGSVGERSRLGEGAGEASPATLSAQMDVTSNGLPAMLGQAQHGNVYAMSSSLSDYGGQGVMAGRFGGDNTSVSGDLSNRQVFPTGPQSFSDAASYSGFHSTLNEPDFAYALQRPGVVPMGESVSSSTMDVHGLHQLQSGAAPYGINRMNHLGQQRRDSTSSAPVTSRSYDMNDLAMTGDQWRQGHMHARAGSLSHMSISSQGSYGNQYDTNVTSLGNGLMPGSYNELSSQMIGSYPQDLIIPNSDFQHQHAAYGNAQAYLQQQHAALQQQQALLQQQQAALALQQQQLHAYGISPGMHMNGSQSNTAGIGGMLPNIGMGSLSNSGVGGMAPNLGMAGLQDHNNMNFNGGMNPPANVGGMNPYGSGAGNAAAGGGYYYVASADGTPMLMSQNPAAAMNQQQGLLNSYGMGAHPMPNNNAMNNMMGSYPSNYDGTGYPDQGVFHPPPNGGNVSNNNAYHGGMSM